MHDIVVVTCVFLVQSLSPEAMEPAFELQSEIFQDKVIDYRSQAYEQGLRGSALQDYVVNQLRQEFAAAWHSMALSSVDILQCGCGHFLQATDVWARLDFCGPQQVSASQDIRTLQLTGEQHGRPLKGNAEGEFDEQTARWTKPKRCKANAGNPLKQSQRCNNNAFTCQSVGRNHTSP